MDLGFRMHAERTPNPDSVKWVLAQPVAGPGRCAAFEAAPGSAVSPVATALFEVEGVVGVMLGPDFVTVSKRSAAEWTELAAPIVERIKRWAGVGEAALGAGWKPPEAREDGEGEVVARIRAILETEIAPLVARDGGQITFAGFRAGVVELLLQGACAGCPSSSVTLKLGIEERLKEEIPEVREVVAL